MLPGWGSAWKIPSSMTCPSRLSSSSRRALARLVRQARRGGDQRAAREELHDEHLLAAVRLVRRSAPGRATLPRGRLRSPPRSCSGPRSAGRAPRAARRRIPGPRSTAPTDRPQRVPRCSRVASRGRFRGRGRSAGAPGGIPSPPPARRIAASRRAPGRWTPPRAARCRSWRTSRRPGPPSESSSTGLMSGHGTLGASSCSRAQLADEFRRQQVAPGREHLAELDEGHAAVLKGQPERPGEPGPPVRGGQLGPAAAALVRQQAAAARIRVIWE